MSDYLQKPIIPFEVEEGLTGEEILNRMAKTSFQGRNLARAFQIWKKMLSDQSMIFLGLAGAMVPAGMRKIISNLIEKRVVDCLVSTGANLFHDCHESLGRFHWQGSPFADDSALRREGINRIYDSLALEKEFHETDLFIIDFASQLNEHRAYTTREFFYLLGEQLSRAANQEGILTSAYKAQVPIYCPAVSDSSVGISLAYSNVKRGVKFTFDVLKDVVETTRIALFYSRSAVIYIGGGTPKNFIQQTEVTAPFLRLNSQGHRYAIQITQDSPQWGGLSGASFEEAQSWGKIAQDADKVVVYADATIALPLLACGLADFIKDSPRRIIPHFDLRGEDIIITNNEV